jgi:hypothetical protein
MSFLQPDLPCFAPDSDVQMVSVHLKADLQMQKNVRKQMFFALMWGKNKIKLYLQDLMQTYMPWHIVRQTPAVSTITIKTMGVCLRDLVPFAC